MSRSTPAGAISRRTRRSVNVSVVALVSLTTTIGQNRVNTRRVAVPRVTQNKSRCQAFTPGVDASSSSTIPTSAWATVTPAKRCRDTRSLNQFCFNIPPWLASGSETFSDQGARRSPRAAIGTGISPTEVVSSAVPKSCTPSFRIMVIFYSITGITQRAWRLVRRPDFGSSSASWLAI